MLSIISAGIRVTVHLSLATMVVRKHERCIGVQNSRFLIPDFETRIAA